MENTKSLRPRRAAVATDTTITRTVKLIVCSRLGQLTCFISACVPLIYSVSDMILALFGLKNPSEGYNHIIFCLEADVKWICGKVLKKRFPERRRSASILLHPYFFLKQIRQKFNQGKVRAAFHRNPSQIDVVGTDSEATIVNAFKLDQDYQNRAWRISYW